ncbi:MAG TPA: prepilin-type N-terminal cleavage/methylation domain-containing protein [Bryobacteraceae bacterium]|nr:prepilin-type N-terminal cleavage/methylation domain-containing protein [Bryobacteraceae bacterium]
MKPNSSLSATFWRIWKGGAGIQPAFGLHRERKGETASPTFSNLTVNARAKPPAPPGPSRQVYNLNSERGVTLIELLIAVTLVSLLAVGILYAMNAGLTAMDRSRAHFTQNRRVSSIEHILESQVADIMPVKAECIPTADAPPAKISFFQGDPTSMRFVTAYSLHEAFRGMPTLLEYQVIPGEDGEGVRLIVNERLYTGPKGAGQFCSGMEREETGEIAPRFVPIEVGPSSFVLADKLAYCRFSYSWVVPKPPSERQLPALWFVHWIKPVLPNAIRFEMSPLHPDAGAIQPLTLTIPVRITRDPLGNYGI